MLGTYVLLGAKQSDMLETKNSPGFALIPVVALLVAMLFAPVDASQDSHNPSADRAVADRPVAAFELPEDRVVNSLRWVGRLIAGAVDFVRLESMGDNATE